MLLWIGEFFFTASELEFPELLPSGMSTKDASESVGVTGIVNVGVAEQAGRATIYRAVQIGKPFHSNLYHLFIINVASSALSSLS